VLEIKTKKTLLTITLAAALTIASGPQAAYAQAAQPNWKDRAEFDLYDQITKEQQPAKRLDLLNQWKEKYPASEFGNVRMQVFAQTYQQAGKCGEAITSANELLAKDANNLTALNVVLTCIFTTPNPTPDQLASADKAASQVLSNLDTLFAADKKPQGVSDADWNTAKSGIQLLAQNTQGYVALQQKNNAKAEADFTKSLQLNPNQGQVSYWLGTAVLAQKDVAKQSSALWQFARAAAFDGPGSLPAQNRTGVKSYLEKAYNSYHGSSEGLDQLLTQAKASAFPPSPDWKILDKNSIANQKAKEEEEAAKANPQLALWKVIKTALTGAEGASYFETNMKGAALPGGANGVQKFVGKLIEQKPKELILGVENATTPDVTLNLDAPIAGKIEPGTEIGFEGVASGYTASPFMVTFDVEKAKLTGVKATAPAPVKRAPVRRPAAKKR
jgi:hypothetical protein